MSRLDEVEKENQKLYLDPRIPIFVKYTIVIGWPLMIGQWIWWLFELRNTPFNMWFLITYIFMTLLVSGLTFLHLSYIKRGYSFTRKIAGKDFQKTLPRKGCEGDAQQNRERDSEK